MQNHSIALRHLLLTNYPVELIAGNTLSDSRVAIGSWHGEREAACAIVLNADAPSRTLEIF
jgi:hypothetical protein